MKILLLLLFFILHIQALENVNLQLKWKHQFQSAGFIIAKEKGFYKDVGLDVSLLEYEHNINIIEDLEAEKMHFAVSDSESILNRMNGSKIKALLVILQKSPYILISLKESHINTINDINGKNIALVNEANGVIIKSLLKSNDIQYTEKKAIFNLKKLLNKDIDLMTGYISNEPFIAKEKNIEINIFNPSDYGFDGYGDILITSEKLIQTNPKLISKMYEATKKGWLYAFENIEETSEMIYKKYNTLKKSKKALIYEGQKLKELSGYGKNFGNIDLAKLKSIGQLYSFMIKGKYNIENLENFKYKPKRLNEKPSDINFTQTEQDYLDSIETIPACYDTLFKPYTMMKDGKALGISVDYLKEIEKKIDKKFKFIYTNSAEKQYKMAYDKKCTVIPLTQTSPQVVPFVIPSVTAGKDNLVLVTQINEPYIFNMETLKDKIIGVDRESYSLMTYLDKVYPYIKYVKVDGYGLSEVENGDIFGCIHTSILMNYSLSKRYKHSLKVMTVFKDSYMEGSIGVHIDEPILLSILNKAVASLEPVTQEEIFEKWIDTRYQKVIDYTLVWQIIAISLILILISLLWNRRLNTEIKNTLEAQKKLKSSEEKFRTLFDISPVLLDAFDDNGRCTLWNKECEKTFGWTKEELNAEDNILALFYPDPKIQAEVLESFDTGIINKYKEWHPLSKSGKQIITMWANVVLPDGSSINTGYDVTELRMAENALKKLNNSLEKSVEYEIEKNKKQQLLMMEQIKLAQMGEMIENIAHQWRQPLAQVNSSVLIIDMALQKRGIQDKQIETKLFAIEDLTQYMSNTIDNFQNFFNPDKVKVLFYLKESVDNALSIIQGTLTANFTVVDVNVDASLSCQGYPLELQQVLVVILSNSNDALKIKKVTNPKIVIEVEECSDTYVLTFCDNAGGIDANKIERIFDPYYTTKHKSQGRGVGLYMAKMIIEEGMKGKLSVRNKNNGACFSIEILKESQNDG